MSLKTKIIFFTLALCQVLDGLFTWIGVNKYGIRIEGNPLVANIMSITNPFLGLLLIKSLALYFIYLIYRVSCNNKPSKVLITILLVITLVYTAVVAEWIIITFNIIPIKN